MVKTELEILSFEDKVAKTGRKYARFETSEGWMSCFEKPIIDTLKKSSGIIAADVQESPDGAFKNIRKIYAKGSDSERMEVGVKVPQEIKKPINLEANKQAGVATRYAVDLCIAGKIELENIAADAKKLLEIMQDLAK